MRDYKAWVRTVDRLITNRIAMGLEDMPDVCIRDLFDDDVPPAEAAESILQQWADGGDLPQELLGS